MIFKIFLRYCVVLFNILLLLFACTTDVSTGGTTEVGNPAIYGSVVTKNNKAAESTFVDLYFSNAKGGDDPFKSVLTDINGKYDLTFSDSEYVNYENRSFNVYAKHVQESDTLYMLHRNVLFNMKNKDVGTDTLKLPGSLSGSLSISDTSVTNIYIEGSPFIVKIEDDGSFIFDKIPPGDYELKIENVVSDIDTTIQDVKVVSDTVIVLDPIIIVSPTWKTVGAAGFSIDGTVNAIQMKIYNNEPYVAYSDSSLQLSVKKYNGSEWVVIGSQERFTSKIAGGFSFVLDESDGTPYIAFVEDSSKNVLVMKFENSDWEFLGNSPGEYSSVGIGYGISMDIYNQEPYITYVATDTNIPPAHQCVIKKYSDSNWNQVGLGVPDTSQQTVAYPHLLIDKNTQDLFIACSFDPTSNGLTSVQQVESDTIIKMGNKFGPWATQYFLGIDQEELYIAVLIPGSGGAAPDEVQVLNYNGNDWVEFGAVESDDTYKNIESVSFDIDQGNFYIAYTEGVLTTGKRSTVKKYNGTDWDLLGGFENFADSAAEYVSIDVSNSVPWVAFKDHAEEGKVTVKKFK